MSTESVKAMASADREPTRARLALIGLRKVMLSRLSGFESCMAFSVMMSVATIVETEALGRDVALVAMCSRFAVIAGAIAFHVLSKIGEEEVRK